MSAKKSLKRAKKHKMVQPWDPAVYAQDPTAYLQIQSQSEMWEISEIEEFFELARQYNIISSTEEEGLRSRMSQSQMDRDEVNSILYDKLRPLLRLTARVKELERGNQKVLH
mmetsp:Transcript_8597/g.13567  ORF Transcript_8597/g.13567 Transcript_8597/m.13567 type:complete len:112 (-) Transcript_8597:154-489(-)